MLTSPTRPEVDGIPVRPDELDRHRYKYYFKGPCCLCSYIQNADVLSEAKIGLAQTVVQPATAKCLGRYVAICATQECDYFGMGPTPQYLAFTDYRDLPPLQ